MTHLYLHGLNNKKYNITIKQKNYKPNKNKLPKRLMLKDFFFFKCTSIQTLAVS